MKFDLKANTQNNLSGKAPITGWLLAPLAYMILSVIGSGLMSVLYIIKYFFRFFDPPPASFSFDIKLVSFRVNNMGNV
ncbi:hypothetical protein PROPEN_04126 [Proteus penneri ATCC 35198]|nr:hypothetical protein PROPEN_04126 [Proteus penneri ATCC 35198]